ncbi:MAG: glycosyltransferase [Vicingaceae bacterium]
MENILEVALFLLAGCYFLQVSFFFFAVFPLWWVKVIPSSEQPPVSVIICGKNEAHNIRLNLPHVCRQEYPNFEVIYVDDHSTDNSLEILADMARRFQNLRVLRAPMEILETEGKKGVLNYARSKASNDVILVTDADCRPASSRWIQLMVQHLFKEVDVVVGIGQYNRTQGPLDGLIQYETMATAISYLAFAKVGMAYMGLGRNMIYRLSSMNERAVKGDKIISGDDDLLVQAKFESNKFSPCINPHSHTYSAPPVSFKHWVAQKRRHHSTAKYYRFSVVIQLFLLKASVYTPYLVLASIALLGEPLLAVIILLTSGLIRSIFWSRISRALSFSRKIYFLPCYEIFFSLFDLWIALRNLIKNRQEWKKNKAYQKRPNTITG